MPGANNIFTPQIDLDKKRQKANGLSSNIDQISIEISEQDFSNTTLVKHKNGSDLANISDSLLIDSNQKGYKKMYFKITISIDELQDDLEELFSYISSQSEIELYKGDNFFGSKLLRVDVVENSKNCWKLDLQDNTGKGVKIDGKSASAVFAIAIVPKSVISIDGKTLVSMFKKSMASMSVCEYINQPSPMGASCKPKPI